MYFSHSQNKLVIILHSIVNIIDMNKCFERLLTYFSVLQITSDQLAHHRLK